MKGLALVCLLSLLTGCVTEEKKSSKASPAPAVNQLKAPKPDMLSLLSYSPLPAKIAVRVNSEEIFDECMEVPETVEINRDIYMVEIAHATTVFETEGLM